MNKNSTRESVKEYYGQVLKSSDDLKTNACCLPDAMPEYLRDRMALIHPDVLDKFYGCGSPIPFELTGRTILDLGCGTGRDSYLLSQLVGQEGKVIGVDMTEEQLRVAKQHQVYHIQKFGYQKSNIEFKKGYIEDLESLDIPTGSVDVVVSNCVINLSPDKERVFLEIFRVLKPGGELYFSDVFAGRRLPKELTEDPVLLGECLGGALYIEDFRRLLGRVGCPDYRVVKKTPLTIENIQVQEKIGMIDFYSITVRAFKLDLEDACEDYGHVAYYQGSIPESPHQFILDDHHIFKKGHPYPVCGNSAMMLSQTRYKKHFKVEGDFSAHFGLFDCAPKATENDQKGFGACC